MYKIIICLIFLNLFNIVYSQTSENLNATVLHKVTMYDNYEFTGEIISQDKEYLIFLTTDGRELEIRQTSIKKIEPISITKHKIILFNGDIIIAEILSQDRKEIIVKTEDGREISIDQISIKEIIDINSSDLEELNKNINEDIFATRYFIGTNGLSMKKGENYIQWSLFGPNIEFCVADNLTVGIITTWIASPILGTIKKSWEIGENTQFALGGLLGTSGYIAGGRIGLAAPFASLSFGDKSKNFSISYGYGSVWSNQTSNGRSILNIATMIKLNKKMSFIFEILSVPTSINNVDNGFTAFIPGLRYQTEKDRAFQFGFNFVQYNNVLLNLPIPMVQWYRKI